MYAEKMTITYVCLEFTNVGLEDTIYELHCKSRSSQMAEHQTNPASITKQYTTDNGYNKVVSILLNHNQCLQF